MSESGVGCPKCGGPSRVTDTEDRPEGRLRRRQCTSARCGEKWKTLERRAELRRGYVQQR